jgi:hypothetical protein
MTANSAIDQRLADFVLVTEVAEGKPLAEPLFQHKYRAVAPEHGHHIFALCRHDRAWLAASYINYLPFQGAMLVGGACTDGRLLGTLSEDQRELIHAAGGLMLQTVRYAEARFAESSLGTFGHCGDARSWSILEQCGYVRLDHPYLIVRWNREPEAKLRDQLVNQVAALGEF